MLQAMGEKAVGRDELVREVADRLDTDPSLVSERVRTAKPLQEVATRARSGADAAGDRSPSGAAADAARGPRAGAAGDVHRRPEAGEASSSSGSREEHMTAGGAPALAWLRDHLDDPAGGLPRDDEELISLITELVMTAEREPASEGAMELNFMLLEQQRLEEGISRRPGGRRRRRTGPPDPRASRAPRPHLPHRILRAVGPACFHGLVHSLRATRHASAISSRWDGEKRGRTKARTTAEPADLSDSAMVSDGLTVRAAGCRTRRELLDGPVLAKKYGLALETVRPQLARPADRAAAQRRAEESAAICPNARRDVSSACARTASYRCVKCRISRRDECAGAEVARSLGRGGGRGCELCGYRR